MESNDKFKEIDIKNCICYYFDDINKIEDFDFDNILIYEKSHENVFICHISYKTLTGAKPVCIRFDKVNGVIRVYDGARYLVLFVAEKYNLISNLIRYLIGVKSGITYVIFHNYAKVKVDLYYSFPLEKILTFHNVIILIKLVFKKDKNNYYYNVILGKDSTELSKNKDNKSVLV